VTVINMVDDNLIGCGEELRNRKNGKREWKWNLFSQLKMGGYTN
jgi:hypothetical protein